jgi:hypothetical protein
MMARPPLTFRAQQQQQCEDAQQRGRSARGATTPRWGRAHARAQYRNSRGRIAGIVRSTPRAACGAARHAVATQWFESALAARDPSMANVISPGFVVEAQRASCVEGRWRCASVAPSSGAFVEIRRGSSGYRGGHRSDRTQGFTKAEKSDLPAGCGVLEPGLHERALCRLGVLWMVCSS